MYDLFDVCVSAAVLCCAVLCCVLQDPRDDVSGEKLVADDMLQFLQEFFEGMCVGGGAEIGEGDMGCLEDGRWWGGGGTS